MTIYFRRAAMLLMVVPLGDCASALGPGASVKTAKLTPADLPTIARANHRGAAAMNATGCWLQHNAAETERDLTYADRLKLNQLRVLVNYASWEADKAVFRKNLVDLARACNRHRIGLMITVGDSASLINDDGTTVRSKCSAAGRKTARHSGRSSKNTSSCFNPMRDERNQSVPRVPGRGIADFSHDSASGHWDGGSYCALIVRGGHGQRA